MGSRHPLQIGECQDHVLVLQTEGVESVFVPQMHFEVADSSSVRAGGRRVHRRAPVCLGFRPWREGEAVAGGRQWARESRESERPSVPSIPLGRSGFSGSRVLCVNGILSSGTEGYIPSFQTANLVSFPTIPVPVKFLRYSRVPNTPLFFSDANIKC